MNDLTKCAAPNCETLLNLNEDDTWTSELNDGIYCYPCGESDMQNCSVLWRFTPDKTEKVYFGNLLAQGEHGEVPTWFADLLPTGWSGRLWHNTDGWRGHFESVKTFIGVTELENGWASAWLDAERHYKEAFNEWIERLVAGMESSPVTMYVLFEPTSNVFSTGVDVFCLNKDVESVKDYLAERLGENGLRVSLG